ncbi:YSIRK-type signal peptide-containing protein [Ligilactobacillus saerimneri]|uniref:YSIRK-type signal peptide-containing protein n=1 Tax=Ligilactobacillus saerimneri TaxID=228229 RepID=A0A7H9EKY7_9LACO|nr:YSIRK-type signal peptide-containing protein [Ligilactobacillus saerimneri]QLL78344.1 YSIRK-type signal peptide-containing protein [Ligilactobacillus saerimneri]
MKRTRKKSFDWYGISQRFSIRKYHFGAASVLLGAAFILGNGATVSADVVDGTTDPSANVVVDSAQPLTSEQPVQAEHVEEAVATNEVTASEVSTPEVTKTTATENQVDSEDVSVTPPELSADETEVSSTPSEQTGSSENSVVSKNPVTPTDEAVAETSTPSQTDLTPTAENTTTFNVNDQASGNANLLAESKVDTTGVNGANVTQAPAGEVKPTSMQIVKDGSKNILEIKLPDNVEYSDQNYILVPAKGAYNVYAFTTGAKYSGSSATIATISSDYDRNWVLDEYLKLYPNDRLAKAVKSKNGDDLQTVTKSEVNAYIEQMAKLLVAKNSESLPIKVNFKSAINAKNTDRIIRFDLKDVYFGYISLFPDKLRYSSDQYNALMKDLNNLVGNLNNPDIITSSDAYVFVNHNVKLLPGQNEYSMNEKRAISIGRIHETGSPIQEPSITVSSGPQYLNDMGSDYLGLVASITEPYSVVTSLGYGYVSKGATLQPGDVVIKLTSGPRQIVDQDRLNKLLKSGLTSDNITWDHENINVTPTVDNFLSVDNTVNDTVKANPIQWAYSYDGHTVTITNKTAIQIPSQVSEKRTGSFGGLEYPFKFDVSTLTSDEWSGKTSLSIPMKDQLQLTINGFDYSKSNTSDYSTTVTINRPTLSDGALNTGTILRVAQTKDGKVIKQDVVVNNQPMTTKYTTSHEEIPGYYFLGYAANKSTAPESAIAGVGEHKVVYEYNQIGWTVVDENNTTITNFTPGTNVQIPDTYWEVGRKTVDGVTTVTVRKIQQEHPNTAPSYDLPKLELTNTVDESGKQIGTPVETDKYETPDGYFEVSKTPDPNTGVTTVVVRKIEQSKPNEAPSYDLPKLELTNIVDETGKQVIPPVETDKYETPDGYFEVSKTPDPNTGVTTVVVRKIEQSKPNEAPSYDLPKLELTNIVDETGKQVIPPVETDKYETPDGYFEVSKTSDPNTGITTVVLRKISREYPIEPQVPGNDIPASSVVIENTPIETTPDLESDQEVDQLPNTGDSDGVAASIVGVGSLLAAFGLAGKRRKKEDED